MKNIAGVVVPRLIYSLDPALASGPCLRPLPPALAFDPCLRPWPLTHAEGDENVAIDRPYWYMKQIAERLRSVMS